MYIRKCTKEQKQQNKERKNKVNTNNKKLKVLVFDDTEIHRQAAKLLLSENYDLTVVGTFDEARKALVSSIDYDLQQNIFNQKYAGNPYTDCPEHEERMAYYKGYCCEQATYYPDFDIVLTDLLVPASRKSQGNKGMEFVGQEMPLGTTIALYALIAGIKMVAVVTDMNHHDHPASAALDSIDGTACMLEGIKILCTNHLRFVEIDAQTGDLVSDDFLKTEEGGAKYPYFSGNWGDRLGLSHGKDWNYVILELIQEKKSFD